MRLKDRVYRALGIVSPSGKWPPPGRAVRRSQKLRKRGEAVQEGIRRGFAESDALRKAREDNEGPCTPSCPICVPRTYTDLSPAVEGRQRGAQGLSLVCAGDCEDPLRSRAERCPECQGDSESCWRCDYEEAAHRCFPAGGDGC